MSDILAWSFVFTAGPGAYSSADNNCSLLSCHGFGAVTLCGTVSACQPFLRHVSPAEVLSLFTPERPGTKHHHTRHQQNNRAGIARIMRSSHGAAGTA